MKMIIETERLMLREFEVTDAASMYALNSDPEVMRYTGDEAFSSEQEAKSFLENYADYNKNGFGRWAVIAKSNNEFIGWCGLKLNEEQLVDLGFRFFKKVWNKGYATESSRACLKYGFEELELKEIIGRVAEQNKASIRVLEKLAMSFWKYDDCKGITNSRYYRIDRSNFEDSNKPL